MADERKATSTLVLAPELAAAIVAAQRACVAVEKNGHNKQLGKSYATGDDIAAAGKAALNANGAAFVRLDTRLREPALADYDIGNMGYAGDLSIRWLIVHESGAALIGSSEHAVIVNRQRPHDKAISASLTYGFGVDLRGALCMEREEPGNGVDGREDWGDGPRNERRRPPQRPRKPPSPPPRDLGPRCSGDKGGHIAAANERRAELLASEDPDATDADVLAWGIAHAGLDLAKYGPSYRGAARELTIADGIKLRDYLKAHAIKLGLEQPADPTAKDAP